MHDESGEIVTPTREEFLTLTGPEKALFYILAFASIAVMAFQIWQRVRVWQSGRPTAELRSGWRYWVPTREALGGWAANIGTYVLGQKKVRASRKRSAAPMHLAIFYGFLVLFIATTLLAINSYSPIKFHQGNFYLAYEFLVDTLGLLFVIGVSWAIVRRVLAMRQEKQLAAENPATAEHRRLPISKGVEDLWVLALLWVVGVTGYWLEAARISFDPKPWDIWSPVGYALSQVQGPIPSEAYRWIWWFHMAWVFLFFALIPRFRLRHIVLAIFSSAGKPERPIGQLALVPMEEVEQTGKVGAAVAADYSRWHLMSLDACMECGRCTEVCPAWNVGKVLNPKQVVQDIRGAMGTDGEVAARVSDEALWACTTCQACVEACPVLIRHVDLIVDARRHLVNEGRLAGPAAVMLRQTGSTGSAWGQRAADREEWMKGLDIPLARNTESFEYLFWVGCAGATDPGAIRTTRAVAQLLKQAGVSFACLGKEEACTGDPARRVGEELLFQDKALGNVETLKAYGVKKVLVTCPHCLNTFRNEYGALGLEIEAVHHTELLAQLVASGKLKPSGQEAVYHDPCYLARSNDVVIPPRELLKGLREPRDHGRKTLCCGAGGGRMWMEESPDQRPAKRRMDQLLETGAETVALGCPFCRIMLETGKPGDRDVRLADVAELLLEANEPVS